MILLHDTKSSDSKTLMELKSKKKAPTAAAPVPGQTLPQTPARQTAQDTAMEDVEQDLSRGGASAAAGVLNAVDEDVEGGEEAEVPDEFEVSDDEAEE